jgi:hypothetical protein
LGSQSTSKFRIVAGGMFGSNTLEEDQKSIGIQVSQKRNCKPEILKDDKKADDDMAGKTAILQTLDILSEKPNLKAVVVCGYEVNKDDCAAIELLSNDARVEDILPIWTCSDLNDMESTDYEKMYDCEKKMEFWLSENINDAKIDIIILDTSAPKIMASILSSFLSYPINREHLSDTHMIVSVMKDEPSDAWRRNFLEQYRKEKHRDPLFRAEIVMKTGHRKLGLEILYCGLKSFDLFYDMEDRLIEALPDYDVEVNRITGGFHYYDPEYAFKTFPDSAYDRNLAIEQAAAQKALGRQSIFQFEVKEILETEDVSSDSDDDDEVPEMPEMPLIDKIVFDRLVTVFTAVLDKMKYKAISQRIYSDVGDGGVVVTSFTKGTAILVWDGLHHVDVNLFSSDQNEKRANAFAKEFTNLSGLPIYLRDDQPRGTGRVVQFSYE